MAGMDDGLRRSMFRYYDERAPEYEQAYLRGTGTSSIRDPSVFIREIAQLQPVVERFATGRLIDLACGTAYWLPYYAARCSSITLFDQSERMLGEARRKVASLDAAARCSIVCADFFDYNFSAGYDCALAGFFLSHLTEEQETRFFQTLRTMLGTSGRFLILDSAWTPERAVVNQKVERQQRLLNDGTQFDIYKRYMDREDVASWERKHGVTVTIEHAGPAFIAVSGAPAPPRAIEREEEDARRPRECPTDHSTE
jgi:SAM-dependent methyltransferase